MMRRKDEMTNTQTVYMAIVEGRKGRWQAVEARFMTLDALPGKQWAIHQTPDEFGYEWRVTDPESGMLAGHGATRKEAIEKAEKAITQCGVTRALQIIAKAKKPTMKEWGPKPK